MDDSQRLANLGKVELTRLVLAQERIISALLREQKRAEARYATEHRRQGDLLVSYRKRIRNLGGRIPGDRVPALPISQLRDSDKIHLPDLTSG